MKNLLFAFLTLLLGFNVSANNTFTISNLDANPHNFNAGLIPQSSFTVKGKIQNNSVYQPSTTVKLYFGQSRVGATYIGQVKVLFHSGFTATFSTTATIPAGQCYADGSNYLFAEEVNSSNVAQDYIYLNPHADVSFSSTFSYPGAYETFSINGRAFEVVALEFQLSDNTWVAGNNFNVLSYNSIAGEVPQPVGSVYVTTDKVRIRTQCDSLIYSQSDFYVVAPPIISKLIEEEVHEGDWYTVLGLNMDHNIQAPRFNGVVATNYHLSDNNDTLFVQVPEGASSPLVLSNIAGTDTSIVDILSVCTAPSTGLEVVYLPPMDASQEIRYPTDSGLRMMALNNRCNQLNAISYTYYRNSGVYPQKQGFMFPTSWKIEVETEPLSPVELKIYFSRADLESMQVYIPGFRPKKLKPLFYNGPNQDGLITNNNPSYFLDLEYSLDSVGYDFVLTVHNMPALTGEIWLSSLPARALPVELSRFDGTVSRTNQVNAVKLFWETSTEINNKAFYLLRSTDEMKTWQVVNEQPGAGTSHSPQYYQYLDKNVYSTTVYYQLKQEDFDGTNNYSPVQAFSFEGLPSDKEESSLYMNGSYVFIHSDQAEEAVLTITSPVGRVLYEQIIQITQGQNFLPFAAEKGKIYIIHLSTDKRREGQTFKLE